MNPWRLARQRIGLLVLAVLALSSCEQEPPMPPPTPRQPTRTAEPKVAIVATATLTMPPSPVPEVDEKRATHTLIPTPSPTVEVFRPSPTVVSSAQSTEKVVLGLTYQRADGNRLVGGLGSLSDSRAVDVQLDGVPRWVVAAALGEGSLWAVILDDGRVQSFRLIGRMIEPGSVRPDRLALEAPPLLRIQSGVPVLVTPPSEAAATLTHPALLQDTSRLVYVEGNGDLVVREHQRETRFSMNALPDARILTDERDRILVLGGATSRYGHGVLGDGIEASSITLIESSPDVRLSRTVLLAETEVIEGLAPIWADLDGDGVREIIVTVSSEQEGAKIVVLDEAGQQVAAGPVIGQGYRWRHQLAVAPFGPEDQLELVSVLTPHIGGVVEFYRLEGEELRIVAQVRGYTSHRIGSRNLDQALAGDLDGDGRIELLVPNQAMDALGGIRRTDTGAQVAWTVDVGGTIRTNLASAVLADGRVVVGLGREDGVLRLWPPE